VGSRIGEEVRNRASGVTGAGVRAMVVLLMLVGPVMVARGWTYSHVLEDFKGDLWNAGLDIVHHRPVYPMSFLARQVEIMRAGGVAIGEVGTGRVFELPLYPAPVNVLMVPFTALPYALVGCIYTLLNVAAMFGGLWLLGVRDWRCYIVVLLSWPFLYGIVLGQVGQFVVLGVGIAWRYRDRVVRPAAAVAAIVVLKVFPWTMAAWLLITRRYRAFAAALAIGAVLIVSGWAIIGFSGLTAYPRLLRDISQLQEDRGDSIATVVAVAHGSPTLATGLCLVAAVGLLALAWRVPDERSSFGLSVMAALAGTPIVWDHYMVLLYVAIAMLTPTFSWLWLGPALLPALIYLSYDIVGNPRTIGPDSPYVLRSTACWLLLEFLICLMLGFGWGRRSPVEQAGLNRAASAGYQRPPRISEVA
jgi:Glycosyltransferase family 87